MTGATHVRVTNGNDFPIEDRYDGVPVVFEPNVAKVIPLEAAALFFGMPVDDDGQVTLSVDWGHFARRHGWTNMERLEDEPMNEMFKRVTAESAAKCALVRVEPVTYTLREVTAEAEELAPPREDAPAVTDGDAPKPRQRGAKMTVE